MLYNNAFWHKTLAAMWHSTWDLAVHAGAARAGDNAACDVAAADPAARAAPSVGALFIVAALSSYFCNTYGVVLNKDMLRNLLQTDAAEVRGLLSGGMSSTCCCWDSAGRTGPAVRIPSHRGAWACGGG